LPIAINSWSVELKDFDSATFDLSVKNPNKIQIEPIRKPIEIVAEMQELHKESEGILESILKQINEK
jgi:type I restriction enzyme M protein